MPTRKADLSNAPKPCSITVTADDGGELFSTEGAARYLGLKMHSIEMAASRGQIASFKASPKACKTGKAPYRSYYVRGDLDRWRKNREMRDHEIVRRLHEGIPPVEVYLTMADEGYRLSLRDVLSAVEVWAKANGMWTIAGPPGSYARWLQRLGRVSVKPADIRRCVEDLVLGRTIPAYELELRKPEAEASGEPEAPKKTG